MCHLHIASFSKIVITCLGISKCSTPATHFPVKFGPVYSLKIRLISHTQTSLQYCPAQEGIMFGRIDQRRTPIIFISGTVKFKNRCVQLYIYISRHKIARFGHECLTKILNLNDSDDC
jgi:hypothetical protein